MLKYFECQGWHHLKKMNYECTNCPTSFPMADPPHHTVYCTLSLGAGCCYFTSTGKLDYVIAVPFIVSDSLTEV